jgi:hypothetical protein
VSSASPGQRCSPSERISGVVAGYQVTITSYPSKLGGKFYDLCAPNADGLYVDVTEGSGHAAPGVVAIFSHLLLLGPNPANWTTNPIG